MLSIKMYTLIGSLTVLLKVEIVTGGNERSLSRTIKSKQRLEPN